jgi:arabinan endo-1,5-alpha-L-arabinosidase
MLKYLPLFLVIQLIFSCQKKKTVNPINQTDTTKTITQTFDINTINDYYDEISDPTNFLKWGSYNVHDPSIIKYNDTYYCYNTDVAFGHAIKPGIQIRYSKDLVQWFTYGWVFSEIPKMGATYIRQNGTEPFQSLWAPYITKYKNEFRLYYSLSSSDPRRSVIGLATATNPEGPWTEKGIVVTSANNATRQTNAIDPTMVTSPDGKQYFYYGSAWDGIYILELNPETGLALNPGEIGKRIANRGFTGGKYNGNIEGPEIIYNAEFKKYYLFMAYDWIDTKYNVRVGKSDSPTGPFYDFDGKDLNLDIDHKPMILAPYQFVNHVGWQGVSHCAVFQNPTDGQYFIAHQGRPGNQKYYMILHVRKIFWSADGWPIVSPERYAWEKTENIAESKIAGEWERIVLNYNILPGYDKEQTNPDFQKSVDLKLNIDKTINTDLKSTWNYIAPWLTLNWSDGTTEKVIVQSGRDWEHHKETVVFTGLDKTGTAVWGKKK